MNNNAIHFFNCSDATYHFTSENDIGHVVFTLLTLLIFPNVLQSDKILKLQPKEKQKSDFSVRLRLLHLRSTGMCGAQELNVLVPKKDFGNLLTEDYRRLNAVQ